MWALYHSGVRLEQHRQVMISQPGTLEHVMPNILNQLSGSFVLAQIGIPIKISNAIYEAHPSSSLCWYSIGIGPSLNLLDVGDCALIRPIRESESWCSLEACIALDRAKL